MTELPVVLDGTPGAVLPAVSKLQVQVSGDEGKTWKTATIELPKGVSLSSDFRVNSGVGISAISIHSDAGDVDLDYLYKFDITGKAPRLTHLYEIGLGDIDASSGVGQDIRMDFNTVAILLRNRYTSRKGEFAQTIATTEEMIASDPAAR